MNITNVTGLNTNLFAEKKPASSALPTNANFQSMLNHYIKNADGAVKSSEGMALSLAKGDNVNLHDVTIAAQKASIAVSLTTAVRDKAVEAYTEIMRMQV
jgi:flagellar hook-basal body complex protein FliE